MVKIGHASIDERGKGTGGQAGDQSGREVCIREWYAKGWTVCLRPKTKDIAEKSAKACEKGCANENIGYDMNQRNTAHTQAKKVNYDLSKIKEKCETDCSAFMTLCALSAGVTSLEYTGNAPTTSTMRRAFTASGAYEALTDSKYLNSDKYLKRGDILVAEGHHTVMVLEDGSLAGSVASHKVAIPTLRKGDKDSEVELLQKNLNRTISVGLSVDGDFGAKTEKALQKWQGMYKLEKDGVYGKNSYKKMKELIK